MAWRFLARGRPLQKNLPAMVPLVPLKPQKLTINVQYRMKYAMVYFVIKHILTLTDTLYVKRSNSMHGVAGVNQQINPATQPQKSEGKAKNTSAVSFNNVFDIVKRSLDGIMVVAENNKAGIAAFDKNKLEIEKKREFKTDLEEAQEILNQITRIMEKHGRANS